MKQPLVSLRGGKFLLALLVPVLAISVFFIGKSRSGEIGQRFLERSGTIVATELFSESVGHVCSFGPYSQFERATSPAELSAGIDLDDIEMHFPLGEYSALVVLVDDAGAIAAHEIFSRARGEVIWSSANENNSDFSLGRLIGCRDAESVFFQIENVGRQTTFSVWQLQ